MSDFDYYTIYFLSLFDSSGSLSRKSTHIYSEFDKCCFSSPEIDYFKMTVDSLKLSNLNVKIFKDNDSHSINTEWLVKEIINNK